MIMIRSKIAIGSILQDDVFSLDSLGQFVYLKDKDGVDCCLNSTDLQFFNTEDKKPDDEAKPVTGLPQIFGQQVKSMTVDFK